MMMPFVDVHARGCTCSYCGGIGHHKPIHYGLNIPPDWRSPVAWYVIKFWPGRYLRWTHGLRWLRRLTSTHIAKGK